jgi:transcriptional regulator with XRE-family HTH domain
MEKSVHTPEYRALRIELQRIRAEAGLSQRDLAAKLGTPHSWVAKVENGERRIDLIEFCWFVAACGLDSEAVLRDLTSQQPSLSAHRKKGRSK